MANPGAIMQGSVYTTVFPPPVGMTTITSLPDKILEIAFHCPGLKLVWPKTVCKTSSGLLDPTVYSPVNTEFWANKEVSPWVIASVCSIKNNNIDYKSQLP